MAAPTLFDRLRDALSLYLPLVLLAVLAAGTWWLVRLSPSPGPGRPDTAASTAPDYQLHGFEVVRYAADGRVLAHIQGDTLRHYPVDERLALERPVLVADTPQGRVQARALEGLVRQEGQRIDLRGEVHWERLATATAPALRVDTSVLHIDTEAARAWTEAVTELQQNGLSVTAHGFEYRQEDAKLQLQGPVKARFLPADRTAPRPRP